MLSRSSRINGLVNGVKRGLDRSNIPTEYENDIVNTILMANPYINNDDDEPLFTLAKKKSTNKQLTTFSNVVKSDKKLNNKLNKTEIQNTSDITSTSTKNAKQSNSVLNKSNLSNKKK